jgi:heptosyltransferase-1
LLGIVALVHGTSRADKQWPIGHWQQLINQLNAAGYGVALPHGSAQEEEAAMFIAQGMRHAQVWPRLPLDALTDALATCTGVIGVDSGLSHMAVALDLPHVQIYNFDTAWRTGPEAAQPAPLGAPPPRQVSVFEQPTPSVESVWQAWQTVLSVAQMPRPKSRFGPSGFAGL